MGRNWRCDVEDVKEGGNPLFSIIKIFMIMNLKEEILRITEIMGVESENNDTGKIFILVGPPSVGKSTWIRNYDLFKEESPYIISRDDIVEEVASNYGFTYDDLFENPANDEEIGYEHPKYGKVIESPSWMKFSKTVYDKVLQANTDVFNQLEQRFKGAEGHKYVVVDMTNMTSGARGAMLNKLTPLLPNHEKIAVVFKFKGGEDLIKKIAQKRAEEYKKMGKSKTIPPEAFDRMFKSFQEVTGEEGFDDVIYVDNLNLFKSL
jgi:tRNA uridine 5-carbamoylmethylation protein Kti12